MTNRINPIETKAYKPIHLEEFDIMEVEREAYIQERYRDTIVYATEQRKGALERILQYIRSWFA